MKVVDREGRLFGRINLVDAAIGAFVVLLVPLAYAAILLLRMPAPRITAVEPAPLTMTEDRAAQGSELAGKLKVRGEALRPVLRAEIAGRPAIAFIFENPGSADVLFGDLPPGTHDLVLYDGRQEVARAPGVVTIPEKPVSGFTRVHVLGPFVDLDEQSARALAVGAKYPTASDPSVEIVALGEPEAARYLLGGNSEVSVAGRWQRDVLALVRCQVPLLQHDQCRLDGMLMHPGQVLVVPGAAGRLRLAIQKVLPDTPPVVADVRVRLLAYPSVLDLVHVGDRDRGYLSLDGRGAVIRSLAARRNVTGEVSIGLAQEGLPVSADVRATDQIAAVDAVLRLSMDWSRTGWRYRNELIRVGGPLTLSTATYVVRGIVLGIQPTAGAARLTNGSSR